MASYTQGTNNQLTKKVWDGLLHESVQDKQFFKGMIGKDKGGEGSIDAQSVNTPIVQKTQLGKDSGDQVTMGLVKALVQGDTYNSGKTGSEALVDNELGLTFHNVKVKIAHYRNGVLIEGKMTEQRSPFSLRTEAKGLLSTHLAKVLDDGVFPTFYMGYSPNVVRELGVSIAAPAAHPNIIYGKNQSSLANVTAADVVDTTMLENLAVAVIESNINPIRIEGNDTFLFAVHARGMKTLRADSAWIDANRSGMPRGDENPIFSRATGRWGNIYVMETNKVGTAKTWASATVTGSGTGADPYLLSISDDTVGAGVSATDVRMNVLIGSNAVARAFALESYMERRKEDDYGNKIGFGGGFLYGDRRADWALAADSGTDGTKKNQSSILVYSYSPNPNSNFSGVW